jgi:transcriptional regulator with XRE-family HTH domain
LTLIGERLRQLRVSKNLSQGDIEERTALLRAYISRLENGHTFPTERRALIGAFAGRAYHALLDGRSLIPPVGYTGERSKPFAGAVPAAPMFHARIAQM